MSYYELFQLGPAVYIPVLLLSLIITIVAYGAVPFIIAKTRKSPITKKKYRGLCYGINIAVVFLFIIINGEASSGGAYFLWTTVFSSVGINILSKRGIIANGEYLKDDPNRMTECKSCGYKDKNFFNACPKCGKYAKQYIYLNENSSADKNNAEDTSSFPDLDIEKMPPQEAAEYLVAEQLGEQYTPQKDTKPTKAQKNKFCSHCGALIDSETKKCSGCGKQYFRGLKFTKTSITIIALVLITATLSALCISQHVSNQKNMAQLESEISNLESEISNLEEKIKNKDLAIKNLNKQIDDLEEENRENLYELIFFRNYAEIVPDDGSGKYHKWGCPKLDDSNGFWIFNTAAAADDYTECSYCH